MTTDRKELMTQSLIIDQKFMEDLSQTFRFVFYDQLPTNGINLSSACLAIGLFA